MHREGAERWMGACRCSAATGAFPLLQPCTCGLAAQEEELAKRAAQEQAKKVLAAWAAHKGPDGQTYWWVLGSWPVFLTSGLFSQATWRSCSFVQGRHLKH